MIEGEQTKLVPSFRLREESSKRQRVEAKCAELEKQNHAFRIAIVALGADPEEIIAAAK